jgi:hypothetical protein
MQLLKTVVMLAGIAGLAQADSLTLRNGTVVQGTYLGGTARQVRMDVNGSIQTYEVGQVQSIAFIDSGSQSPPSQPPPPEATFRKDTRTSDPVPRNPDSVQSDRASGVTIPADTLITVRMIDAVDSRTARPGETFRASLDNPVIVDGQEVIPRGSDVLAKLVDDQQSGKIQGRTVLTLGLVSISVRGQMVDVATKDVKKESASRTARSAGVIGGGTALGASIGGLAGGGKGAAIGAVSGAAVGTGAQVLTSGQEVKIPSDTRLTFTLQSSVQI